MARVSAGLGPAERSNKNERFFLQPSQRAPPLSGLPDELKQIESDMEQVRAGRPAAARGTTGWQYEQIDAHTQVPLGGGARHA